MTRKVFLRVDARTMTTGRCLTTWFDWQHPTDHSDARAVRTCQSTTNVLKEVTGERSTNSGMLKFGVCYAPNQQATGCTNGPNTDIDVGPETVIPALPNDCTWSVVRSSGGTVSEYNGGLVHDCDN